MYCSTDDVQGVVINELQARRTRFAGGGVRNCRRRRCLSGRAAERRRGPGCRGRSSTEHGWRPCATAGDRDGSARDPNGGARQSWSSGSTGSQSEFGPERQGRPGSPGSGARPDSAAGGQTGRSSGTRAEAGRQSQRARAGSQLAGGSPSSPAGTRHPPRQRRSPTFPRRKPPAHPRSRLRRPSHGSWRS